MLKPPGMTSHDVVAWTRRRLGSRRVGHAGTLDPLAAGVLLLLVGEATRASAYLQAQDKAYRAELVFGLETDAGDLDGRVVARRACPDLDPARVAAALGAFRGTIRQRPPRRSAVKVGGEPLYRRARRGEDVDAPEREVRIRRLELVDWIPDAAHPRALLDLECSSGTYVRSLARDLGAALGCGACLAFLLRTRVGRWQLEQAVTLEELEAAAAAGRPSLQPLAEALDFLPGLDLSPAEARAVHHGQLPAMVARRLAALAPGPVRLLSAGGLVAIANRAEGRARLERVFADAPRPGAG